MSVLTKIFHNRIRAIFTPKPEQSLCLLTVTRKRLASWITSLALCLWAERLQQRKRKTSVRKGRHVRWASVAALEFFCSDHMTRKTIMLAPKSEQHVRLCIDKDKMPVKRFSEVKSAQMRMQAGCRLHAADGQAKAMNTGLVSLLHSVLSPRSQVRTQSHIHPTESRRCELKPTSPSLCLKTSLFKMSWFSAEFGFLKLWALILYSPPSHFLSMLTR